MVCQSLKNQSSRLSLLTLQKNREKVFWCLLCRLKINPKLASIKSYHINLSLPKIKMRGREPRSNFKFWIRVREIEFLILLQILITFQIWWQLSQFYQPIKRWRKALSVRAPQHQTISLAILTSALSRAWFQKKAYFQNFNLLGTLMPI